jgi:ATP-dependent DNA helicase RecG
MFFDRWEITSPGRLPGPLTPADLQRGSERLARNPRLAEAMRILGYGQGLGLGLSQARVQLEAADFPPPMLAESATAVTATLAGGGQARRRLERLRHYRSRLLQQGGTPRQLLALEHFLRHPTLTNTEYRRLADVSDATALRDLTNLVERGLLARHGAKRGAYYTLADEGDRREEP